MAVILRCLNCTHALRVDEFYYWRFGAWGYLGPVCEFCHTLIENPQATTARLDRLLRGKNQTSIYGRMRRHDVSV